VGSTLRTFAWPALFFALLARPGDCGDLRITIPDTALLDQHGRTVRLYSDLVKGRKVVVINTIFTTCTTICPVIGVRFARLQKSLAAFTPQEYSLISISVDPATDTPERLRAWADQMGARPGWTLLTGPKMQVDEVLRTLTLATPDKLTHSPAALVGADGPGGFVSCNALAPGDALTKLVRQRLGAPKN
jgi:protein SCO1/2